MTTAHPNSLVLEAFACGDEQTAVAEHLGICDACDAFVEKLRALVKKGPSLEDAKDFVAKIAARVAQQEPAPWASEHEHEHEHESPARTRARRRWFWTATSVGVPLAAAAVLVLLMRSPETRPVIVPTATAPTETSVPQPSVTAPDPETTFKGTAQIAVIRERGGLQARFVGSVRVRPGDRLRLEVALDREQAILGGVLADDGDYLELMPQGTRGAGTHFSEKSARIDPSPMAGTIVIGPPEAVKRAVATKKLDGVARLRVEWEGVP